MNYKKAYDNLINTRKIRVSEINVYYEKHHIVMRSMGGDNSSENIVKLTAREHFLAHWLLWRIYKIEGGRNAQLAAGAFNCMCMKNKYSTHQRIVSSRAYQEAREAYSKSIRGENHPNFGKSSGSTGKKWSDESREKIVKFLTGRKQSKETIEKRSKSLIGKKTFQPLHSTDAKTKISSSLKKSIVLFQNSDLSIFSTKTRAIINRYIDGASAPEISLALNMKVATVRSVIFSAKNILMR